VTFIHCNTKNTVSQTQFFHYTIFNTTSFGLHGRDYGLQLYNTVRKMKCDIKVDSRTRSNSWRRKKWFLWYKRYSDISHLL